MEEKVNGSVVQEEVVVTETPPVVVKPAEKKREGFPKVVAVILFVIIVAMAGFIVWHFLTTNHEVKECEAPKDDESGAVEDCAPCDNEAELSDDDMVRNVVKRVREKVQDFLGDNIPLIGVYNDDGGSTFGLAYKPEGLETGVPMERTYGFRVDYEYLSRDSQDYRRLESLANNNEIYDVISGELLGRGFVDTGERYTMASTGGGLVTFVNETEGIVCGVMNWPTFGCAFKAWYNEADARLSNELLKVYNAENKDGYKADYVVAQVDGIKEGGTAPYQTIMVGMAGSKALFYREGKDGAWHFVTRGQYLPCSAFDTDEAKKAFAGTVCQTEVSTSVVQP